jgi:hypothetical protein
MRIIAVDCGLTGALASLDESGELRYFADLPVAQSGSVKWIDGGKLLTMLFKARAGEPGRVFIEQTGPMPKLGIMAASSKGLTLGSVLAIVQVAQLPIELVSPMRWKRALGLVMPKATDGEKKAASLQKARLLFPKAKLDRVCDHNRAEAMLIAEYARRFALGAPGLFGEKAA